MSARSDDLEDDIHQSSGSETSSNFDEIDLFSPPSVLILTSVLLAVTQSQTRTTPRPLHNSMFTGRIRLDEWQERHPEAMGTWLGVDPEGFNYLLGELVTFADLRPSRFVACDEKLAIFLYICRSACGVRHAAEAFQRGLETTAGAFRQVLECMTSLAFYTRWVKMPTASDPPSPVILDDPRFSKFFQHSIGAIDGTHIPAHPPASQAATYRNRKGGLSMNVLAACSFDLKFTYILSGWEGSAHDGKLWNEAINDDLIIPDGRYLLADAGFSTCRRLLVPYRGVRYHLQEWAKSKSKPAEAKELYNLRHSSARNVIERIFGVAKRRWRILAQGCEWDIETQARMVYGIAVLHNMLRDFEYPSAEPIPSDAELRRQAAEDTAFDNGQDEEDRCSAAYRPPGANDEGLTAEKKLSESWRSMVAQSMWLDYCEHIAEQAARRKGPRR